MIGDYWKDLRNRVRAKLRMGSILNSSFFFYFALFGPPLGLTIGFAFLFNYLFGPPFPVWGALIGLMIYLVGVFLWVDYDEYKERMKVKA
jgi:hypothetical protein